MANNVFPGDQIVLAKDTITFIEAGLTSTNCKEVYLIGDLTKSWRPTRTTNGVIGFEEGKSYHLVMKEAMDLSIYLMPPIILNEPGDDNDYLNWPDRRPLGLAFLGSYPTGETWVPDDRHWIGSLTNSGESFPAGTLTNAEFRANLLAFADNCLVNLEAIDAQGMVVWDIEGQEFPHAVTYIGDPRVLSPEMLHETGGVALCDEFFAKFTNAGYKLGITLRPDEFVLNEDGFGAHLVVADPYADLEAKAIYANTRWGATIFYVDSNVASGYPPGTDNTIGAGPPMHYTLFKNLSIAHPDWLWMPEWETNNYFGYSAPWNSDNLIYPVLDSNITAVYPDAFCCVPVGSGAWSDEEMILAVEQGHVLMARVWYESPEISRIIDAYNA